MPKVKIKRKGLAKYQQRPGTVQVETSPFALPDFLNNVSHGIDWHTWNSWVNQGSSQPANVNSNSGGPLNISVPNMKLPSDYVPSSAEAPEGYFEQQSALDAYASRPFSQQLIDSGIGPQADPEDSQKLRNIPKPKSNKGFNGPLVAALSVGVLGRVGDSITRGQSERAAMEAAKRQGMSDAAYSSMRNVYSRGRTPEGYAYNMMVPVQFSGAYAPEMYGQPQIRRAQEGLSITRDVLGMPELYPAEVSPMINFTSEIPLPSDNYNPPVTGAEALYQNTERALNIPKGPGQISYTHNNPLNVHFGKFAQKYGASKGSDDAGGNVAIFPDLQTGIKANTDLLFGSTYINLPISKARNKWVSGNPDTPNASTNDIVKAMGKDVPLSQLSPKEKDKLFKLFAKWEGSQAYKLIKDIQIFEKGGEINNEDINDNDMTRKVRITKAPEMKHGGQHLGDQQNYGLYRGGGYLQDYVTGTEVPDDTDIRATYPEEPSEETANVEVEKGELIKDSQGLYKVGGKKHSQGGTKANVEEGAYVFSDYIKMNPLLAQSFNFDPSLSKKKDNTIAKLLNKKVDSRDYNRLKAIISNAEAGKDVDPLELKTAQNRIADYDKYISRAALAGELSKAMEGKPFQIPEIGIPALEELTSQSRENFVAEQPMTKAKYGMQYMAEGDVVGDDGKPKKIKKSEVSSYLNQGFKQDPKNPNRLYKEGTAGSKGFKEVTVEGTGSFRPVKEAVPGGAFNKRWEDWLINQLQSGVTIDELVKKKHGTYEGLKKYEKYYVPGKPEIKKEEYDIPGTPGDEVFIEDEPKTTITTTIPPYRSFTIPPPKKTNPYLQDILNYADVASRSYTDVPPTRVSTSPAYIDPAFLQPNYFPIQSQAAQASRDAALYGRGAQGQSAVLQNIQANALPAMGQLQTAIGAQNVATDMGARQFNAQAYMQNQGQNAAMRKQYADEVAQYIWNKDASRIQKNTAAKNAINQTITNWGNTKLMNQRFPQMAFDPMSYDVFYKPGSGRSYNDALYGNYGNTYGADSSQWNALYQKEYEALSNVKDEKIRAARAAKNADMKSGMFNGNSRDAQLQQMQMMQQQGYGAYVNPFYMNSMNSYMGGDDDYTYGGI